MPRRGTRALSRGVKPLPPQGEGSSGGFARAWRSGVLHPRPEVAGNLRSRLPAASAVRLEPGARAGDGGADSGERDGFADELVRAGGDGVALIFGPDVG